jgi:hypothetical protein
MALCLCLYSYGAANLCFSLSVSRLPCCPMLLSPLPLHRAQLEWVWPATRSATRVCNVFIGPLSDTSVNQLASWIVPCDEKYSRISTKLIIMIWYVYRILGSVLAAGGTAIACVVTTVLEVQKHRTVISNNTGCAHCSRPHYLFILQSKFWSWKLQ